MGLAKDRLNGLLASPSATSVAHIRALALLAWIVTDNATWVMLHFAAFPASDITYRLLWLFDAVVITVEALQTATIYGTLLFFNHLSLQLPVHAFLLLSHLRHSRHSLQGHIHMHVNVVYEQEIPSQARRRGMCPSPAAGLVGVQMLDRWRVQRAQLKQGPASAHPWEGKGGLLYHIDLGLDLVIRVHPSTALP